MQSKNFFLFPNTHHIGCYFHFSQCIYRKIQSLGLSTAHKEDDEVRSTCRQLMTLPFLPMQEIEFAFEESTEPSTTIVNPLMQYFKNYWIEQMSNYMWSAQVIQSNAGSYQIL